MADEPLTNVEDDIAAQVGEPKIIVKAKREPTYRVIGDSKIPVSKKYGPLWKSRLEQGKKKMKGLSEAWEEAIRYFDNDQMNHRQSVEGGVGNNRGNQRLNNNITETENIVFSNITTMVAALYARNPKVEFTANNDQYKKLATATERVVNTLIAKRSAPGVNLKPKARRGVTTALLTNRAWLEVNWVFKNDSSEQALADLETLANELKEAKEEKDIEEIEGKLIALDDQVSILQSSGPVFRLRAPKDVIIDWSAEEQDGSDAKWIIVLDWLPTSYLRAKWGKKRKDTDDEYESVFQPSHILKLGATAAEEGHSENEFSLFEGEDNGEAFGYRDKDTFDKAKMTRVAFVWDKMTRRVFLYNVKDWTWPIWVWDDPLQLDTFYNVFSLYYHDGPCGLSTKGEVTYYLDQQDAINEISHEERVSRRWARRNVFFNKNLVDGADVEAVLNGDDGTARGLNLPEGMKLQDVIGSIIPPSMQFQQLFDKQPKYQAIDRVSGLGQVLREGQFKTNANKDAVKFGASVASMRVDDKSDQIEDWLGAVGWALGQLCLMNMSKEEVASLVGREIANEWRNLSPQEIASAFAMRVVGGSTKKPTSQAKKEEALELGQVLGQFVNAAPQAVTTLMIEVFQQAFDEVTMTDEKWEQLKQEMGLQAQANAPVPSAASTTQSEQVDPQAEQIKQMIAQLPQEAQQQLQVLVQQGVPPSQALQQVTQQTVQ